MKSKKSASLAMGIAFVGFTTQFGGGFASGAQIYQYFINYGVWALLMPVIAQFLLSLFYWYGMRYAYRHKTYDYRSFSDSFYGRARVIFSNLYEIEYFVMVCMAPAVAFATGGATLQALTGIPFMLCTLIIGIFIFAITLFGTDIVRKCSSVLSVLIIAGLFAVLIPNIIAQWGTITDSVNRLAQGIMPVGSTQSGSFGSALWRGCVYGIFQLTAVGLMYQHTKGMKEEKEAGRSMIYMFIVDAVVMELTVVGLLAVAFLPELKNVSVPMLLLVQNGVGAKFLTPVISILIILGAVSTGVNMIAGIVERSVHAVEKREQKRKQKTEMVAGTVREGGNDAGRKHRIYTTVGAFLFTLLTFGIAQFGLIPLVKVGYAYIGYATLFVIVVPFMIRFIMEFVDRKNQRSADSLVQDR